MVHGNLHCRYYRTTFSVETFGKHVIKKAKPSKRVRFEQGTEAEERAHGAEFLLKDACRPVQM